MGDGGSTKRDSNRKDTLKGHIKSRYVQTPNLSPKKNNKVKLRVKQGVQKILLVWTQGKMCLMFQKATLI
jgi:hypothetical protein